MPVVLLALVAAAALAVQRGWFSGDGTTTANTPPSAVATAQTSPGSSASPTDPSTTDPSTTSPSTTSASTTSASPANPGPDSTSSSATTSSSASSASSDGTAAQVLADCRAKVAAADDVLAAAKTGIGHWSEHVQAQTDANSGDIGVARMDAIFKATRLVGPDDVRRYDAATNAYDDAPGSCDLPAAATGQVKERLAACATRSRAQQPVLDAADNAMDDWKSHLAAMRRSRMGHVHDAQGIWIRAWKAAPHNIDAYDQAVKDFDAPTC